MTDSEFIAGMAELGKRNQDITRIETCAAVMNAVMLERIANALELIGSDLDNIRNAMK